MPVTESGYDYGTIEPSGFANVPTRVYHGTGANINDFKISPKSKVPRTELWFTGDASVAQHYAFLRTEGKQKPKVYHVDLDWRGVDEIPLFSRTDGDVRAMKDWAKENGYPALWITSTEEYDSREPNAPELVIINDRKVGIQIEGTRQLKAGQDHEGWLSDIGIQLIELQKDAIARGEPVPLGVEDCSHGLKEKFADHPNRDLIYDQIDDICEQRNRRFAPELTSVQDAVAEYQEAKSSQAPVAAGGVGLDKAMEYRGVQKEPVHALRRGRGRMKY